MNYTYIVECSDGTFYTGWTNDLDRRIDAHNSGKGAKYTKTRRPVTLVYYEMFETKEEAMRREYEIKQYSRRQKEKLIDGNSQVVSERQTERKGWNDMRKVILFIAMSLDGYIADKNGSVSWLQGQGADEENVDTYSEFIKDIDTVFMGWNTYHQIVTELSPEEWVYEGLNTYVFTHRKNTETLPFAEQIYFTEEDPVQLIKELQEKEGKNIWICGGAELVRQLREAELIDRYHISIMPTLIGKGIRLFGEKDEENKLHLMKVNHYNGITELIYELR